MGLFFPARAFVLREISTEEEDARDSLAIYSFRNTGAWPLNWVIAKHKIVQPPTTPWDIPPKYTKQQKDFAMTLFNRAMTVLLPRKFC